MRAHQHATGPKDGCQAREHIGLGAPRWTSEELAELELATDEALGCVEPEDSQK